MTIIDSLRIAWTALRSNLLRSILTTLGIVIGVASVIILVAVGSGARSEVEKQIASLGSNMLVVFSGSSRVMGRAAGAGTDLPLAESDLAAIRDKIQGVVAISGQLNGSGPVVNGSANWTTTLSGVHPDYTTVRDWPVVSGRDISMQEMRASAKVAVLGQSVAKQLFQGDDPVGAIIRVKNTPFQVIGVLASKGPSSFGRDQDDLVLLPMTTARGQIVGKSQVQADQVGQLYIKFEDGTDLKDAQEDIETLLRQRRRVEPGGDDNFSVRNLAEFMKARTEVLSTMTYLLAATSAISLIVGGIGIMNIMLVSVTERTREIGLRMAVGGRHGDIMRQFLVEAVTLCLIGGFIGIALGVGAAVVVANAAQWPVLISPSVIALAMAAAAGTGVVFGYFPARRAANLNPIEALRSE
ncbi:MAG: ABC transporter permease [Hyphomicrobium sp.]|jgi:putative ABC transport system permease protein|nr:ABC transporter permease [Hyphomicrobium sp.]